MSKASDTRTAILEEALDLSTELGLEGLTIGTLARRVRMSKSGLFAHFRSKEELQSQVLDAAAERFTADVIRTALRAPRGRPRLEALFDRWVTWSAETYRGGCPFIAAATELDDREGPVRDTLVGHLERATEFLRGAVQRAIDEGHFRADLDVGAFVFEYWGILLGFHHFSRLMRDGDAGPRARAAFTKLLDSAA